MTSLSAYNTLENIQTVWSSHALYQTQDKFKSFTYKCFLYICPISKTAQLFHITCHLEIKKWLPYVFKIWYVDIFLYSCSLPKNNDSSPVLCCRYMHTCIHGFLTYTSHQPSKSRFFRASEKRKGHFTHSERNVKQHRQDRGMKLVNTNLKQFQENYLNLNKVTF